MSICTILFIYILSYLLLLHFFLQFIYTFQLRSYWDSVLDLRRECPLWKMKNILIFEKAKPLKPFRDLPEGGLCRTGRMVSSLEEGTAMAVQTRNLGLRLGKGIWAQCAWKESWELRQNELSEVMESNPFPTSLQLFFSCFIILYPQ